jgi:hypothetical protein
MKTTNDTHEEMKHAMDAQLNGVKDFLKMAFCIDGEVVTTGKEVMTIEQDGTSYKGISFTLNDSKRGEFKVVLSNPNPQDGE